jgi:CBS domain
VTEAARIMSETAHRHLPVVSGDRLVGIVGISHIVDALTGSVRLASVALFVSDLARSLGFYQRYCGTTSLSAMSWRSCASLSGYSPFCPGRGDSGQPLHTPRASRMRRPRRGRAVSRACTVLWWLESREWTGGRVTRQSAEGMRP